MRTGAELVRASKVYAQEDVKRTWVLFLSTVVVQASLLTAVWFLPWWPAKLCASVLAGLVIVRLFIFYHDYLHGALFRGSFLGKYAMYAVGFYTMAAPSVWKETHDYHHQNNAKLIGSTIGSYPLVSLGIWKAMTPTQRRMYRVIRNPWIQAAGLFTTFVMGMCVLPLRRDFKQHWPAALVLVGYILAQVAVFWVGGWQNWLFAAFLPGVLSSALGSYLFYAQHNFPGAEMKDRREWSYAHAALRSSSMFDMSLAMHWFTGNIGFHHVHHLNHQIPFYRLPEAMAGMPELQDAIRTSWALKDVWGCLRIGLWDPGTKRMISYREADELIQAQHQAAAK